jgi:F-type H+-transporting ATPase subunit c
MLLPILMQDVAVSTVPNFGAMGAGIGLGRIGGQVAEAIARQPEATGEIRAAGLLFGVLLEGATIIALVFALLFKLIK